MIKCKSGYMIRTLASVLLFFTILVCQAQEGKDIAFAESSWAKALRRAKKEKKAVFLYAYTPSCRWCKQMEQEVFTNSEVADFYNSNFVSHKINIEDGAEGEALAKEYGIVAFPTYLYFDKEGELVHQGGSAKPADEFILDGRNAFNPQRALYSLKRRYDSGDRSAALLYNYSNALSTYHHVDSPEEKVVEEYLRTQPAPQLESEENLKYIFNRYLSFNATATQYFLKNQHKFTAIFEEGEVKSKAEKIITKTARTAGSQNDAALFQKVEQAIAANFKDTSRLSSLARIFFFGGQGEWLKYAKATLEYGRNQVDDDWQTLYETAIYLRHFAKDKQALEIGAQIMEKAIIMNKSYDNLYLYAQLQQNIGREASALDAAREAVKIANKTGKDSSEAASLVSELQAAKEK